MAPTAPARLKYSYEWFHVRQGVQRGVYTTRLESFRKAFIVVSSSISSPELFALFSVVWSFEDLKSEALNICFDYWWELGEDLGALSMLPREKIADWVPRKAKTEKERVMAFLMLGATGPPIKRRAGLRIKQAGRGSYRGS
uniref:Uncharacterized protein n=1 Tax=Ananas comosus var. bracteatus TaxID=296719 RepID=A0A6V7NGG6_ANACO|nr:unnamed protein product [Ananas comosus var. bracteatus]